jgi:hypothetical protein
MSDLQCNKDRLELLSCLPGLFQPWDQKLAIQLGTQQELDSYGREVYNNFKALQDDAFHSLPIPRLYFGLKELLNRAEFNTERDEVGIGNRRRSVEAAVLCVRRVLPRVKWTVSPV